MRKYESTDAFRKRKMELGFSRVDAVDWLKPTARVKGNPTNINKRPQKMGAFG